jgi:hypothetical protein
MRTSTRRTTLVGTAAGLSLALLVPLAGPAAAHDSGRQGRQHHSSPASSHHGWHDRGHANHGWHDRGNPAEKQARAALRQALAQAKSDLRRALKAADRAYRTNPVVMDARADLASVLRSATDPAVILAAKQAYLAAVAGPTATRTAAVDAARSRYMLALDTAYVAYDTVALGAEKAAARAAYRAAVREAKAEFTADRKAAYASFRAATSADYAALRAAVNQAFADYRASSKTPADATAFKAAVRAAWATFMTDSDVMAAKAALRAAVQEARVEYVAALKAAREAFGDATGHRATRHHHGWGHVRV